MSMPDPLSKPVGTNKTVAAGLTGAVAIVLVWALGQFGVTMPGEVAVAVSTIFSTAAVYLTPHGGGTYPSG